MRNKYLPDSLQYHAADGESPEARVMQSSPWGVYWMEATEKRKSDSIRTFMIAGFYV